jgi:hypothetical protein
MARRTDTPPYGEAVSRPTAHPARDREDRPTARAVPRSGARPPAAAPATGSAIARPGARRVVSLVPSLTEAVAVTAPGLLAAATDWCSHPAELDVPRIGGTKNPDVPAIIGLRPDLVIANEEENRAPDLDALRAAGLPVLVTEVRSLPQAFGELERVLVAGCGLERPAWLDDAEAAWRGLRPAAPRRLAVVPVWRRPWMALGRDTFAGDLLARLGVDHVYAGHAERYPRFDPAALTGAGREGRPARAGGAARAAGPLVPDLPGPPDLVVLPDEPYAFTADDGPEAFPGLAAALVSGRHLTWYGPSLVEAGGVLGRALREGPT